MSNGTHNENDLVSRIKRHPFVVVLVLLAVFIGGLAAFSRDVRDLWRMAVCIPYDFGITEYEGSLKLTEISRQYEWKKIDTIERPRGTANHHCSKNCKDEPTRTNYTIIIEVPKSGAGLTRELRNPVLRCVTGPCGGWREVIYTRIETNGAVAKASFDVWSKPTTWTLSADVYELQPVTEIPDSKTIAISNQKHVILEISKEADVATIEGAMEDGRKFSFSVNGEDATGVMKRLSTQDTLAGRRYTFTVSNPRCDHNKL